MRPEVSGDTGDERGDKGKDKDPHCFPCWYISVVVVEAYLWGHHGYDLKGSGRHVPFRLSRFGTVLFQQVEVTAAEATLFYNPTVLGAPVVTPAGWPT